MRITHRMMVQSVTRNLRNNLFALEKKANQLSNGRYFDRPSQDPVGAYKVMRITGTSLLRNEQFRRNIGEGIIWLTVTEDALADAIEGVQRLRELAVYAANGTLTPEDREMISPEVKELLHHLVTIGNSEVGGLYIFGGHKTLGPPYLLNVTPEETEINYAGDDLQRLVEITPGQAVAINLTGEEAFDGVKLFKLVDEMYRALLQSDPEKLGGEILKQLDGYLDHLLQCRAKIGARMQRLWTTEDRLVNEHLHLRELRSKIEDIDVAELITEFTMQENAYHTSLAASARMLFPSLIDFLR